MPERYGMFDNTTDDIREYSMEDFARFFTNFLTSGVFSAGDNLKITCTGNDLKTTINLGRAWIQGFAYEVYDTPVTLQHDIPDATYDRIDRIILRLDKTLANRYIKAFILKGTPAEKPIAPALTRDNNVWEISLGRVTVIHNKVTIDTSQLIDDRLDTSVCGLVNSLLQANTTDLFNQYQDYLNQKFASNEFQDWLTDLKSKLNQVDAFKLQLEFDNLKASINTGIGGAGMDLVYSIIEHLETMETTQRYLDMPTMENTGMIYSLLNELDELDMAKTTAIIENNTARAGDIVTRQFDMTAPIKKVDASLTVKNKYFVVRENMANSKQFKTDTDLTVGDKLLYNEQLYNIEGKLDTGVIESADNLDSKALAALSDSGLNARDITKILWFKNKWYMLASERLIEYNGTDFSINTAVTAISGTEHWNAASILGNFMYLSTNNNRILRFDGTTFIDVTSTFKSIIGTETVIALATCGSYLIAKSATKVFMYDGVSATDVTAVTGVPAKMFVYDKRLALVSTTSLKIYNPVTNVIDYSVTAGQEILAFCGTGSKAAVEYSNGAIVIYDDTSHLFGSSIANFYGILDFLIINNLVWVITHGGYFYAIDLVTGTYVEKTARAPVNPNNSTLYLTHICDNGTDLMMAGNSGLVEMFHYSKINQYTVDKDLPLLSTGTSILLLDARMKVSNKAPSTNVVDTANLNIATPPTVPSYNKTNSYYIETPDEKNLTSGDKIDAYTIENINDRINPNIDINDALNTLLPSTDFIMDIKQCNGYYFILCYDSTTYNTFKIHIFDGTLIVKTISHALGTNTTVEIDMANGFSNMEVTFDGSNYLLRINLVTNDITNLASVVYGKNVQVESVITDVAFVEQSCKVDMGGTFKNKIGQLAHKYTALATINIDGAGNPLNYVQKSGIWYSGNFTDLDSQITIPAGQTYFNVLSNNDRTKTLFIAGYKIWLYDNVTLTDETETWNPSHIAINDAIYSTKLNAFIFGGNNYLSKYTLSDGTYTSLNATLNVTHIIELPDYYLICADSKIYKYNSDTSLFTDISSNYNLIAFTNANGFIGDYCPPNSVFEYGNIILLQKDIAKVLETTNNNVTFNFTTAPKRFWRLSAKSGAGSNGDNFGTVHNGGVGGAGRLLFLKMPVINFSKLEFKLNDVANGGNGGNGYNTSLCTYGRIGGTGIVVYKDSVMYLALSGGGGGGGANSYYNGGNGGTLDGVGGMDGGNSQYGGAAGTATTQGANGYTSTSCAGSGGGAGYELMPSGITDVVGAGTNYFLNTWICSQNFIRKRISQKSEGKVYKMTSLLQADLGSTAVYQKYDQVVDYTEMSVVSAGPSFKDKETKVEYTAKMADTTGQVLTAKISMKSDTVLDDFGIFTS